MEAAPPSYETATLIDYWDIIARYIPSGDLCAAALVCSRWHATFIPHIWGNPAAHFGIENDAVYVALTRFKRTLQTARLLVRSLTHTLHLPPAHAEIYNGPQAEWLRDILERLPNLQSLIVRGLPFFDYAALQALSAIRNKPETNRRPPVGIVELPGTTGGFFQSPSTVIPSFGLRLLDASRCPNITSSGLAAALSRFEGLIYLDLSFSHPARDRVVLETLKKFPGLQVLKLRDISLKEDGLELLCRSIGLRVRSLDVRDNFLTDHAVRTLLDHCFTVDTSSSSRTPSSSNYGQRSPTLLPYLGSEMLEIYQGEEFEGYLRNAFTGHFVSRLAIEDAPPGGITHLYISGNHLTVEGVSGLARSNRLHVLDVGSVAASGHKHLSPAGYSNQAGFTGPGVEKLTPTLWQHGADALTFLRINHSLVTKYTPNSNPEEVVQGRVELGDTSAPTTHNDFAELDGQQVSPETFELSAEQQTPRFELEGDPMRLVVSPAVDGLPEEQQPKARRDSTSAPEVASDDTFQISNPAEGTRDLRRGSAAAPEVIDSLAEQLEHKTSLLSPVSAMGESTMANSSVMAGLLSPLTEGSPATAAPPSPQTRPRSYSNMAMERRARLNAHISTSRNLHPAMLPHVKTLVLTNVPPFSATRDVADRIVGFIQNCAEEAASAHRQAEVDYSLPPGRREHTNALRYSADRIFALKRLVLELGTEDGDCGTTKSSPWQHRETRSMTEDRDSEALWNASETDFSFFGEEESMFPTIDNGQLGFYSGAPEVSSGRTENRSQPPRRAQEKPKVDNVSLIAAFRKERKLAYQRALAAGNLEPQIEGLWHGTVQVVRSNAMLRSDEEMDYYGNKFTNNYLYR